MLLGTQVDYRSTKARKDFAAFIDASDNKTIKTVPLPDAASMRDHPGGTDFDVKQFPNGEIFIVVEKSQPFRVVKADYTVTDVTRSFFLGKPELAVGVAKVESLSPREGQGFKLVTNDGKTYLYDMLTGKVFAKDIESEQTTDPARWAANTAEFTAFAFSRPFNADFPDVPAQLIQFRYRSYVNAPVVPVLEHYSNGNTDASRWDNPQILAGEGVLSHHDFTPGRNYFNYGVLYFDSEYVLITYRASPATNSPRYVQLMNAKNGAIVFTTRLENLYAPPECVRYKDGFAIADIPSLWSVSSTGEVKRYTPFMYKERS